MHRIALRIDDITPRMDWERFARFAALLDEYDIHPLIGVIPDNKDETLDAGEARNAAFDDGKAYAKWLKSLKKKGWCIAMHGYDHVYITKKAGLFPLNPFSEFAGVPADKQLEKISKGKEILSSLGADTDIFMAPGHSFDKNTLHALSECGFHYVTDGYGSAPYTRCGLTFLPISLLRTAELKKSTGTTSFVVHCAQQTDAEFNEYRRLFEEERERFMDYPEYLKYAAYKKSSPAVAMEYALARAKGMAGRLHA